MTTDFTSKELVYTVEGAAEVSVERDRVYRTDRGPLRFDLYRPTRARAVGRCPAVVFVSGLRDPGVVSMFGKPLKDWASYVGWARLVAASGVVGVTYTNREPADVTALLSHLRADADSLGIDPTRIGVWACSGNVPTALALVAREPLACAAFLYGYLLDLDGATCVAEAAAQFHFAAPAVSLDELSREMPMLVVRAGLDATPGLDATLQRFVAAARARHLALSLLDHPQAPHAFDLVDDSPATHAVVEKVLDFLQRELTRR
jgi:dienelactone hydrolase